MGGWKQEAGRFLLYVTFPVASFWMFNQPFFVEYAMKRYKQEPKHADDNRENFVEWKNEIKEARKKAQFEKLLREKMEFEEARRFREQNKI